MTNVGSAGPAAPAAAGGAAAAAPAEAAEEKKEEGTLLSLTYRNTPPELDTNISYREGGVRRGHGLRSLRLSVSLRFRFFFSFSNLVSFLSSTRFALASLVPDTTRPHELPKREKICKKGWDSRYGLGAGGRFWYDQWAIFFCRHGPGGRMPLGFRPGWLAAE